MYSWSMIIARYWLPYNDDNEDAGKTEMELVLPVHWADDILSTVYVQIIVAGFYDGR